MRKGRSFRRRSDKKRTGVGNAQGTATIQKISSGAAFLILDGPKKDDLYLPQGRARAFFDGDWVKVDWSPRNQSIERIQLIERRKKEVFARLERWDERKEGVGYLRYERKKASEELRALKVPAGVRIGDWVKAKLLTPSGGHPFPAEVISVHGKSLPASMDIEWVASEYGLREHYPEKIEKTVVGFSPDAGHKDLRSVPFITIDGETARDFDDAVYVERKGELYILWVAIADVTHYVKEGDAIDQEASYRGTSVYFPERAFHMLPSSLSENICSLKPNEPRHALVARMAFTRQGLRTEMEFLEGTIESKRRATYNELEKEREKNEHNESWQFRPHYELYSILKKARTRQGALDFELKEPYILVDSIGEPTASLVRERLDSHRLIEAFMIAANEAAAEWMLKRKEPFIFRIHETPSAETLTAYRQLAKTVGLEFPAEDALKGPLVVSKFLRELEGKPSKEFMTFALLRSMKQAVYSDELNIHYGLASKAYTHFTSPIRRYPDLIAHRLLKESLHSHGKPHHKRKKRDLAQIASHCSKQERIATEAERESLKLKQCRLAAARIGQSFKTRVIGLTERGLFLEVHDPFFEGFLPVDRLQGTYKFDERRMVLQAKNSKKTIRIGDSIRIIVANVNIERRQIDFEPEN